MRDLGTPVFSKHLFRCILDAFGNKQNYASFDMMVERLPERCLFMPTGDGSSKCKQSACG